MRTLVAVAVLLISLGPGRAEEDIAAQTDFALRHPTQGAVERNGEAERGPLVVSPANPFAGLNAPGIANTPANTLSPDEEAEFLARCRIIVPRPDLYGAFAVARCITYARR
ncbi:MAG: hypothetical protein U1E56_06735 [Bauldia sp.]